ncbi:MAG: gamma-glutamylcyclotransferase family protein [Candidatus Eremiobacterota bacterium]
MLDLFVYGSLKPGERNYGEVAAQVVRACPGTIPGRMYLRETGYPTLWLPPEAILGQGSRDYPADLRRTRRPFDSRTGCQPEEEVAGTLLRLSEGERMLRHLDWFEEVNGDYIRSLVAVRTGDSAFELAWVYRCTEAQVAMLPTWRRIPSWPPDVTF